MAGLIEFPATVQTRAKDFLCRTLRSRIQALEDRRLRCHIPRLHHLYVPLRGMPYHFKPELFLQLGGTTEFNFPDERIVAEAGSVCIVPGGMPHGEVATSDREPFENLVASFYNQTVYLHIAHERAPGFPAVDSVYYYTTDLFPDLISYLERVGELHSRDPVGNAGAIRALLLAELSLLLALVETPTPGLPPANDTVARCKWLIHQNLHDERLNLESLAAELGCSGSTLSRLFHRHVGERIIEHVNRLRIQNARDALRNTRLSAKVIAVGCGYRDAGYFGRVFRRATGRSPQQYRREAQRIALALEMRPKTVYADDKNLGAPPSWVR